MQHPSANALDILGIVLLELSLKRRRGETSAFSILSIRHRILQLALYNIIKSQFGSDLPEVLADVYNVLTRDHSFLRGCARWHAQLGRGRGELYRFPGPDLYRLARHSSQCHQCHRVMAWLNC